MKKLLIIIVLCIVLNTKNHAQSQFINAQDKFLIGWEVAFPSNDVVSETSFSGGRFEYRRMVSDNVSVGAGVSWNSFSDYTPTTTYQKEDGTGAITTDLVTDVYTVPITLEAHYYFKGGKKVLPYIGIGLGTQYADQTLYFNIYAVEQDNWGFVARPQVGVMLPFSGSTGAYLSAAYNYATNKNDTYDANNLSQFVLSIGLAFGSR